MTANEEREQIRRDRLACGMTQEELARRASVNRSKLSLYEQGFVGFQRKELKEIKKILKAAQNPANFVFEMMRTFSGSPDEISKIIKGRKRWRREVGLSQHALAKAMGIQQSKLSEWESGKVDFTDDEIKKYVKAINDADAAIKRTRTKQKCGMFVFCECEAGEHYRGGGK